MKFISLLNSHQPYNPYLREKKIKVTIFDHPPPLHFNNCQIFVKIQNSIHSLFSALYQSSLKYFLENDIHCKTNNTDLNLIHHPL